MKYLKIFEEYEKFHLDEISQEEYDEMNNRAQRDLKYGEGYIDADITQTKNKFKDFGYASLINVDRYNNTNYKVNRLNFSFSYDTDKKEFHNSFDFIIRKKPKPEALKIITFFISKYKMGENDEPIYKMTCHIKDSKENDIWKYFLFEEQDLKLILQDPKKYVEIIVNEYLVV